MTSPLRTESPRAARRAYRAVKSTQLRELRDSVRQYYRMERAASAADELMRQIARYHAGVES
jgi:hypothetical protein